MKHEIVIAGFGGQGVMAMGKLLAYAGMMEGKEVSWMPSYGPEMRGGTANCVVIISDDRIASPLSDDPDVAVVMNLPSLDKFAPMVKDEGILMVNSSLINKESDRDDLDNLKVPCNEIANEIGSSKIANMVAAGALIKKTGILPLDTVVEAMKKVFAGKDKFFPMNEKAIRKGAELV